MRRETSVFWFYQNQLFLGQSRVTKKEREKKVLYVGQVSALQKTGSSQLVVGHYSVRQVSAQDLSVMP